MRDDLTGAVANWLTRARVWRLAIAGIFTYLAAAIAILATAQGGFDALGIPLGFDFLAFHEAARLALAGDLTAAFDPVVFGAALEQKLPGVGYGYYWLYPPTYALTMLPFGVLPYGVAFWVWTALGLAAYGAGVRLLSRDRLAIVAALGFPAVWVVAYHGQNAFFVAALFAVAAHALLTRKDALAGLAIGLLAIKPHLAILIPLALAASGRWRAFAYAGAVAISFTALSTLVFGGDYLDAFLREGSPLAGGLLLEEHHWATIASVFVAVKLLGAPTALAWSAHAAVPLAATALVAFRFKRDGATAETLALLVAASLLISPYVMDYDLVLLAVRASSCTPRQTRARRASGKARSLSPSR
ncbi:MAG: glycosyltransferase family 87 protein [Parvularculaceae bacterium]